MNTLFFREAISLSLSVSVEDLSNPLIENDYVFYLEVCFMASILLKDSQVPTHSNGNSITNVIRLPQCHKEKILHY